MYSAKCELHPIIGFTIGQNRPGKHGDIPVVGLGARFMTGRERYPGDLYERVIPDVSTEWRVDGVRSQKEEQGCVERSYSTRDFGCMGQEYRIDRERRVVFSSGYGDMNLADFLFHHRRLLTDPDFNPKFHHIVDLTCVKQCILTPEGVKMLADQKVFSDESRRAFLVEEAEAFASSIEFQSYRESVRESTQVRVFDDFDDAMAWLSAGEPDE